jgi:hypothetical protein
MFSPYKIESTTSYPILIFSTVTTSTETNPNYLSSLHTISYSNESSHCHQYVREQREGMSLPVLGHLKSTLMVMQSKIENTKSNLPLPEQPPTASDWNSADQRAVNVGSGGVEGPISGDQDTALRGPATASSSAREVGSETHRLTEPTDQVGRGDFPKDARAR